VLAGKVFVVSMLTMASTAALLGNVFKGLLWIGTAVPLMAVSGIYVAWRNRTNLAVAAAVVLACYVPFVLLESARVNLCSRVQPWV